MTTDISKYTDVFGTDIFAMAGTQDTGLFIVVAVTDRGRVGFRDYSGNGDYRVRVEPLNDEAAEALRSFFPQASAGLPKPGSAKRFCWKVPGQSQNRFSTTCSGTDELKAVLQTALTALVAKDAVCLVSDKDACPAWAKELVATCVVADSESEALKRARLIKRIREAKLPGCNACSRWSTATLLAKFVEADAAGKVS